MRAAGRQPDGRVAEAMELVVSKRAEDGRWMLDRSHHDGFVMEYGEVEAQPSRWNTLRAMRVLRWFEQSRG
jgi:hypothetical protein